MEKASLVGIMGMTGMTTMFKIQDYAQYYYYNRSLGNPKNGSIIVLLWVEMVAL